MLRENRNIKGDLYVSSNSCVFGDMSYDKDSISQLLTLPHPKTTKPQSLFDIINDAHVSLEVKEYIKSNFLRPIAPLSSFSDDVTPDVVPNKNMSSNELLSYFKRLFKKSSNTNSVDVNNTSGKTLSLSN